VAKVVVAGATLECSHGGRLELLTGSPSLQVAGQSVVTSGMESGLSFAPGAPGVLAPCPIQTTTSPPAPSPCSSTGPASTGLAAKLVVGGTPVLLDGAGGTTVNAQSPGTWSVADAGQTQLEAS
jgi:hypothetical protein